MEPSSPVMVTPEGMAVFKVFPCLETAVEKAKTVSETASLKEKGRIKKLTIIAYDHDPDCYYTLLGDRLVFWGHVYFDENKPTQTDVDYTPLIFTDDNKVGQRVIKNFQKHFDNMVNRYKHTATLYPYH